MAQVQVEGAVGGFRDEADPSVGCGVVQVQDKVESLVCALGTQ